jgi:succinate dehydrogenase / fumarate reductase cytochrome b subunit
MYHPQHYDNPSSSGAQLAGAAQVFRSTVGRKIAMAISGAILVLWIIGHMLGNLKVFLGPKAINDYAEGLRTMGEPFFPRGGLLWIVRIGLILAAIVHIVCAAQLTLLSRAARPVSYRKTPHLETSYASRTMRWGGVIILAYAIYHLMHLTFGNVHPDFVAGDVYHNLVIGFRAWPVVLAYVVATGMLMFHLYHGIWSALQTLGASHPHYDALRRRGSATIAILLFAGLAAVPLAVLTGVLR